MLISTGITIAWPGQPWFIPIVLNIIIKSTPVSLGYYLQITFAVASCFTPSLCESVSKGKKKGTFLLGVSEEAGPDHHPLQPRVPSSARKLDPTFTLVTATHSLN